MSLNPGESLLNGHYRILRLLGRGGFGSAYLAEDLLLGEQVAIKELIPALVGDDVVLKRFLAEAGATMRLTHERIVRTHNVFSERGNYYIAMEYMAGGSLETRLQRQKPLSVDEAVRITAEVCEGLSYAHQRGVVHCDLKPANVLFASDGSAKVADFGIAHVSEQLVARTWQTSVGFVAGTLPYMSPEQANGVRDDPRIDIFALGAVLYRMLTGRTYLEFDQRDTPGAQADNVLRLRTQQVTPPSNSNRRVPPWLDGVVLKALAKEPGDRYASADELQAGLLQRRPAAAPAKARPPSARPTPKSPQRGRTRWPGRIWLLVGGIVVLCLAIVIVTIITLGSGWNSKQPVVVTLVITPPTTPTPSATVEPATPIPSPTVEPPTATPSSYFEDDFGDASSGWDIYDSVDTWAGYQDGEYRLAVYKPDLVAWANPNLKQEFTDFIVEVDARLVEGPVDNNYGVLVRHQPGSKNFYLFQISSDGYFSVDMLQNEKGFAKLVDWQTSEAIHQGLDATNRLAVICNGSQFSFSVNGTHLMDVNDSTFRSGTIGLAVGTFDETGVVVHFDNLRVRVIGE